MGRRGPHSYPLAGPRTTGFFSPTKWFLTGGDFTPKVHLAMCGDIRHCHSLGWMEVGLTPSGQRPGVLLNPLQCTGRSHNKHTPRRSGVLRGEPAPRGLQTPRAFSPASWTLVVFLHPRLTLTCPSPVLGLLSRSSFSPGLPVDANVGVSHARQPIR